MIKIENRCVGCERCIGLGCSNRRVAIGECDECRDETYELYLGEDGGEYCKICVLNHLTKVVIE